MIYRTKRMFVPIPQLVPLNAGQWGMDDSVWKEEWGVRRRIYFTEWNNHVVTEGM